MVYWVTHHSQWECLLITFTIARACSVTQVPQQSPQKQKMANVDGTKKRAVGTSVDAIVKEKRDRERERAREREQTNYCKEVSQK